MMETVGIQRGVLAGAEAVTCDQRPWLKVVVGPITRVTVVEMAGS
jgi:hypothetical protein